MANQNVKKLLNPTKVITGVNTRLSYANVWDPKSINGGAPKYSVSLIIPKSDTKTIDKINAAIQAAYEEGQSKLKGNGKSVPALTVIKTLSATATLRDRTMRPTRTATSSTPTLRRLPESWMQTGIPSWSARKSTPAYMQGHPSTCTPSTATATRESPAV